jgi:carboxyl-terminal processing protease
VPCPEQEKKNMSPFSTLDPLSRQPHECTPGSRRNRPGFIWLLLCALLVCVAFLSLSRADGPKRDGSPTVKTGLTPERRRQHIESFELVWKTVRDRHYDPTLGGVNWRAVRSELRPRLEKADSDQAARAVMQEMLGRLGHSHVAIVPASLYEGGQGNSARARQDAVPGFDVRVVDGEALVVGVSARLPAARAGVRSGWRIRKIDGEDLAPALARIRKAVTRTPDVLLAQAGEVLWRLRGTEGKEVAVTFQTGAGEEVTLTLRLARPRGNLVRFGHLPPFHVHFEARKVDNDIAYFALNSFLDPLRVLPAFGQTVQDNLKGAGFILDLRGNPGGIAAMAQGLGGWFVDRPDLKLGTTHFRDGFQHAILNPREATYQGPLAILVDEFSASTSEILAGGLQDLKRARVFGTRTAGAALPSHFIRLPNGDGLQYVVADYVSAGGRRLEGNGVQPDEVVPPDRRALLAGRDPALDAAVRWIRSQRGGPGVARR